LTRIAEEDRRRRRPSARGSHGGAAGAGRSPAQSGARVARAVTPCLPRVQSLLDRGGHAGSSPIRASAGRGGPGEAGGGARKHNARVMFSDAREAGGRGPCCLRRRDGHRSGVHHRRRCTGRARRPRADKSALSDVPSGATCASRGPRGPPRPGRVGPGARDQPITRSAESSAHTARPGGAALAVRRRSSGGGDARVQGA
jgi:hypothetical protein